MLPLAWHAALLMMNGMEFETMQVPMDLNELLCYKKMQELFGA